jgi:hypothetical protein
MEAGQTEAGYFTFAGTQTKREPGWRRLDSVLVLEKM